MTVNHPVSLFIRPKQEHHRCFFVREFPGLDKDGVKPRLSDVTNETGVWKVAFAGNNSKSKLQRGSWIRGIHGPDKLRREVERQTGRGSSLTSVPFKPLADCGEYRM